MDQVTKSDPRDIIAQSDMTLRQYAIVGICIFLNALDGFDVLSISFASPGIAEEWGIDRAGLGIVLSMELVGMMFGGALFGRLADQIGRRPTLMLCIVLITAGMFAASLSNTVVFLSLTRLVTGFGVGGMLSTITPLVAEFSSIKRRSAMVGLMTASFSLGAIVGGSVSSVILAHGEWRDVFLFGAICTAAGLPVIYFFVPESVGFLLLKKKPNTLERLNKVLRSIGQAQLGNLPPEVEQAKAPKSGWRELFSSDTARITTFMTVAFFFHIITAYFILKWTPKIVADMGYSASQASIVLVWASVGSLGGGIFQALLSLRFDTRWLTLISLILGSLLTMAFGIEQTNLAVLSWVAGLAMFFVGAGQAGIYMLIALLFPTALRASGTGFVTGVGRGGAAVGPILAGFLFAAAFSQQSVSVILGSGSLIAAFLIFLLTVRSKPQRNSGLAPQDR